ncbi:zinc finger protein 467-like [Anguilla rostrata]|nr:zinc finger protein 467-like isoform X2 [Anguilla anguilla]XP_035242912.1 zinc finger protein 467-like isoform X2 [Anguilla anguilla]XP_035242913.1 zinc finger protein 467-like isoform X2 [Anguilla anguilla]
MAEVGEKADAKRAAAAAATTKVREAALALTASEPEKAFLKERPFPCTLCDKRFLSKSHFREHQRVHTGERPFPCGQCDRSFTTQHNLKRHLTIHEKEESYRCRRCGVLFCHVHKNASRAPPKPKHRRHPKAAGPPPGPLSSSKAAFAATHPASKKKAGQGPSPSDRAARVQRKGVEPGVVTLRRNAGGLQNKIAYDIEVVL